MPATAAPRSAISMTATCGDRCTRIPTIRRLRDDASRISPAACIARVSRDIALIIATPGAARWGCVPLPCGTSRVDGRIARRGFVVCRSRNVFSRKHGLSAPASPHIDRDGGSGALTRPSTDCPDRRETGERNVPILMLRARGRGGAHGFLPGAQARAYHTRPRSPAVPRRAHWGPPRRISVGVAPRQARRAGAPTTRIAQNKPHRRPDPHVRSAACAIRRSFTVDISRTSCAVRVCYYEFRQPTPAETPRRVRPAGSSDRAASVARTSSGRFPAPWRCRSRAAVKKGWNILSRLLSAIGSPSLATVT